MQYILTEKEYKNLVKKADDASVANRALINKLCMEVAKYKPVPCSWDKKRPPAPWGCIHTECPECGCSAEDMMDCDCELPDSVHDTMAPYCDDCPVQNECTLDHTYSK